MVFRKAYSKYRKVSKKFTPKKRTYRRRYGLTSRVKRIVRSMEETKQKTTTYSANYNSGISSVTEFYPVIPSISQGDNEDQRQGGKVMPTYLKINFIVKFGTGGSNLLPIHPTLFILCDKSQRDSNQSWSSSYILKNGSSQTQFDGTWSNSKLPVDTESFRLVRRKRFRLALNAMPGSSSTTLTDPDAPMWREYSVTLNMRKYAKFLDYNGSQNMPTNLNMCFAAGYSRIDDTTDLTGTPLTVMMQSTLYYKDA